MRKEKKKRISGPKKKRKKKPLLQGQHIFLLFPTKVEQFVHVHFEQQNKEEYFHTLIKNLKRRKGIKKNKKKIFYSLILGKNPS